MALKLDEALLERMLSALRGQGAPIADRLAPGLSDEEMDNLTAPVGLQLPAEARTWWGWHNGITTWVSRGWEIGADIGIYTLAQAVEELELPLGGAGQSAPSTWLPLAQAPGGPVVIDCAGTELAPVHRVDYEMGFSQGPASMGEMVLLWSEMIESGAWAWNKADGRWDRHFDLAPERAESMHVI